MTEREKLIKLLGGDMCKGCCCYDCEYDTDEKGCIEEIKRKMADHLIDNGVTLPKRGRWLIRSTGKGANATNWAECSECRVCGSPQWKVCPVCETKMDLEDNQ